VRLTAQPHAGSACGSDGRHLTGFVRSSRHGRRKLEKKGSENTIEKTPESHSRGRRVRFRSATKRRRMKEWARVRSAMPLAARLWARGFIPRDVVVSLSVSTVPSTTGRTGTPARLLVAGVLRRIWTDRSHKRRASHECARGFLLKAELIAKPVKRLIRKGDAARLVLMSSSRLPPRNVDPSRGTALRRHPPVLPRGSTRDRGIREDSETAPR
jgi:hypothetical protein